MKTKKLTDKQKIRILRKAIRDVVVNRQEANSGIHLKNYRIAYTIGGVREVLLTWATDREEAIEKLLRGWGTEGHLVKVLSVSLVA